MPLKTRGGTGKAKSHVFPTKTSNKAKGPKAAAKSKPELGRPKKKVRTEAPASKEKKPVSLLDLPPEIRLMIYRHVMDMQGTSVLRIQRGMMKERGPSTRIKPKRGTIKTRYHIKCCGNTNFETTYIARNSYCLHHQGIEWSLMWICSLIRKEVMPMMFENRRIYTLGLDALVQFLKDLTPDQRASIRHLDVDHCCDQTICPRTYAEWEATFRYIAENLQLKSLSVEARCGDTEYDEMVWFPGQSEFMWLYEVCKMRNLEKVNIDIMAYEPEIGYENWADFVNEADDVELDEDGEPKYDPSFDWIPSEVSLDITWRVAQKVLSPAAWKALQEEQSAVWLTLREMRVSLLSDVLEDEYDHAEFDGTSSGFWPSHFEVFSANEQYPDCPCAFHSNMKL